jgi:hypothetical protein
MSEIPESVQKELSIQKKLDVEESRLVYMIEGRTAKYITPLEDRLKVIWQEQMESRFREINAWQK